MTRRISPLVVCCSRALASSRSRDLSCFETRYKSLLSRLSSVVRGRFFAFLARALCISEPLDLSRKPAPINYGTGAQSALNYLYSTVGSLSDHEPPCQTPAWLGTVCFNSLIPFFMALLGVKNLTSRAGIPCPMTRKQRALIYSGQQFATRDNVGAKLGLLDDRRIENRFFRDLEMTRPIPALAIIKWTSPVRA